jgi:carbon storage regulator CsrA
MLVLSRKVGERIHIGDDVFVEVRRVSGSRVTLAVNAPRTVRVLRGELLEAAKSFEQPAAEAQPEQTKSETYIVSHESTTPTEHFPGSQAIG